MYVYSLFLLPVVLFNSSTAEALPIFLNTSLLMELGRCCSKENDPKFRPPGGYML